MNKKIIGLFAALALSSSAFAAGSQAKLEVKCAPPVALAGYGAAL